MEKHVHVCACLAFKWLRPVCVLIGLNQYVSQNDNFPVKLRKEIFGFTFFVPKKYESFSKILFSFIIDESNNNLVRKWIHKMLIIASLHPRWFLLQVVQQKARIPIHYLVCRMNDAEREKQQILISDTLEPVHCFLLINCFTVFLEL